MIHIEVGMVVNMGQDILYMAEMPIKVIQAAVQQFIQIGLIDINKNKILLFVSSQYNKLSNIQ